MSHPQRRTKIIATIGPASEHPKVLGELIDAGMDVARLNLSHSPVPEAMVLLERLRRLAAERRRHVGIMVDLPGPKIRVAPVVGAGAALVANATVTLRPGRAATTAEVLEVDYEQLLEDLQPGDRIGLADGQIVLEIESLRRGELRARVLHGGVLRGRPGVHLPSERLSIATPTEQDLRIAEAAVAADVDFLAVSFVRSGADLRALGTPAPPAGPLLVAKIETREAVENLDDIIEAAGAIMVARGDLGNEFPIERLPHLQKRIIRRCIARGLPAITATQMLESMIESPLPTRAEASDVANAVFDGTSGVMLSGETAIGAHPVHVVATMARIAGEADARFDHDRWAQIITDLRMINATEAPLSVTDAITMAASRVVDRVDLAALLCVSGSGFTVRSMARFRPRAPILGFSNDPRTVRQLSMSWGVEPVPIGGETAYEARVTAAVEAAHALGRVRGGDLVAVLAGINPAGRSTDVLRLLRVPENLDEPRTAPRPAR